MLKPSNNSCKRPTVLLVASALLIAACSGREVTGDGASSSSAIASNTTGSLNETTTTATATPTKSSDDVALAAVLAALDSKNSFDLDTWLAAHEGGERRDIPLLVEQILMNARQQLEIVEPCQVTGQTSSGETMVSCLIQDVTGFWGVGGISDAKLQTLRVNSDGLITNKFTFSSQSRASFNRAFHQWLSDTYPDVYNELGYESISENLPGFDTRNPDHMLVAVEYVEEFVAQSDKYPLDPSDQ